jgi:lysozyme
MKMGEKGIDLIKHFEGFSPTVYRCPSGVATLGYGSTHGITMDSPPITKEGIAFNLGNGSLQASTLRKRINREDYEGAANEFPRWVFAGGRKLRGLVKRRYAERELFLTPT